MIILTILSYDIIVSDKITVISHTTSNRLVSIHSSCPFFALFYPNLPTSQKSVTKW